MTKSARLAPLALLLAPAPFLAQAAIPADCPPLADPSMAWVKVASGELLLCRATRSDGSDAFSLMYARKPAPLRGDVVGHSQVGGQDVEWHAPQVVDAGVVVRQGELRQADGERVQLIIRARDDAGVQRSQAELARLRIE